jgi:hypothetical protein
VWLRFLLVRRREFEVSANTVRRNRLFVAQVVLEQQIRHLTHLLEFCRRRRPLMAGRRRKWDETKEKLSVARAPQSLKGQLKSDGRISQSWEICSSTFRLVVCWRDCTDPIILKATITSVAIAISVVGTIIATITSVAIAVAIAFAIASGIAIAIAFPTAAAAAAAPLLLTTAVATAAAAAATATAIAAATTPTTTTATTTTTNTTTTTTTFLFYFCRSCYYHRAAILH